MTSTFSRSETFCSNDRSGRVAGRVGQRAGRRDRADERRDAPVVATELEDLLDHGAVLGLELAHGSSVGASRRVLVDLDEEAPLRIGLGGARDPAVQPLERDGGAAARQPDAVGDRGHRADACVLAAALGDEQHALLVADLDGQGHVHVREDDDVFQRDEQELAQRWLHTPSARISDSWYEKWYQLRLCLCVERRGRGSDPARSGHPAGEHVGGDAGAARAGTSSRRHEHAAAPEDQPTVVAGAVDPACLVQHLDTRPRPMHLPILRGRAPAASR